MAVITLADLGAVADLIEAALERPATERGAFLRDACAGDPSRLTKNERLRIYRAEGDSSSVAHVLNCYGLMQVRADEVFAGSGLLERAVAMGKAELGPVHTRVAVRLCNLAFGFDGAGEYDAAAAA